MSRSVTLALLLCAFLGTGCAKRLTTESPSIVGAWRSSVQFESGPYSAVKDLEFMYVFHADGTMMESSNYDAMPPVPPAYGVWRPVGMNEYEARYEFFTTAPPADVSSIPSGGGWSPSGRGVLVERIKVASDGKRFTSRIQLQMLDQKGQPAPGGAEAEVKAERIG